MRSLCCTLPVFSFHFLLLLNSSHGEFNHLSAGSWGWFWKGFFLFGGWSSGRLAAAVCVPIMPSHTPRHEPRTKGLHVFFKGTWLDLFFSHFLSSVLNSNVSGFEILSRREEGFVDKNKIILSGWVPYFGNKAYLLSLLRVGWVDRHHFHVCRLNMTLRPGGDYRSLA